ncbi:MAG: hypothetical protein QGG14_01095 [Planctomycetota bacterium]|nr:hypothetical protein [Planctomycetota bacterium]
MGLVRLLWFWFTGLFDAGRALCDTCKYDYGDACTRPERPNARRCSDYRAP